MSNGAKSEGYVTRVLVAFDQFINVTFGGNPDETISARTGRDAARGYMWARGLKWMLDKMQRNHTDLAVEHDKERAQTVECIEQGFEDKSGVGKPDGSYIADHLRNK